MSDHVLTSLLQGALEDHIHRQHVPGAVVAVTGRDGGPVVFAAGFEDFHRTQPMRAESRFPIWSISKTFLAVVMRRLARCTCCSGISMNNNPYGPDCLSSTS